MSPEVLLRENWSLADELRVYETAPFVPKSGSAADTVRMAELTGIFSRIEM